MGIDILGIGTITIDDLIFLDRFPQPDSKMGITHTERQGGGLTATALVAAARLGMDCAFVNVLGDDESSQWMLQDLQNEGIDTSHVTIQSGVTQYHAYIIVEAEQNTRTILYGRHIPEPVPFTLDSAVIQSARLLFIDDAEDTNGHWMREAAHIAREAHIPIVADFEQGHLPDMVDFVDHCIVPLNFATRHTGQSEPEAAVNALWNENRALVAVTHGNTGCWYRAADSEVIHQPAFKVDVVDTTGAGDVFHGAYCAALLWEMSPLERIRFASAVAALKVTRRGGRAGIPTRQEVDTFLKSASL